MVNLLTIAVHIIEMIYVSLLENCNQRAMKMEVHECVSFILVKGDQVLLETRAKDKESDPGAIAIPGGHMELNETQQQTLLESWKKSSISSHFNLVIYVLYITQLQNCN